MINPRWPYLPERQHEDESSEEIQRALESVPDDPMNYDFHYHILEADENGRQPKIEVATEFDQHQVPISYGWRMNPLFNRKSVSCLRLIADSKNKVNDFKDAWSTTQPISIHNILINID